VDGFHLCLPIYGAAVKDCVCDPSEIPLETRRTQYSHHASDDLDHIDFDDTLSFAILLWGQSSLGALCLHNTSLVGTYSYIRLFRWHTRPPPTATPHSERSHWNETHYCNQPEWERYFLAQQQTQQAQQKWARRLLDLLGSDLPTTEIGAGFKEVDMSGTQSKRLLLMRTESDEISISTDDGWP